MEWTLIAIFCKRCWCSFFLKVLSLFVILRSSFRRHGTAEEISLTGGLVYNLLLDLSEDVVLSAFQEIAHVCIRIEVGMLVSMQNLIHTHILVASTMDDVALVSCKRWCEKPLLFLLIIIDRAPTVEWLEFV